MNKWQTYPVNGDKVDARDIASSSSKKNDDEMIHCLQTPIGLFQLHPLTISIDSYDSTDVIYNVTLDDSHIDVADSLSEGKRVVTDYIKNVIDGCNKLLSDEKEG